MRIRPVIALSAAALAVSITVVPLQASASSTASGVAVASGTVTTPGGAAASGIPVDLYAWPSDAVLKAMKPGQMVPRTLLTTATTNSSGQYTLSVPATSLTAAEVDNGYANLEIDSAAGIWFLAYQPGKATAAATVNLPAATGAKKTWPCGREPKRAPFDGGTYAQVGWWLVSNHPAATDVVGQAYIAGGKKTAGDWVSFQYAESQTASQTSTLGVGLSGYGLDAGYSTSGTHSSSASAFQGFPTEIKNTLFGTGFTSATYRADCIGPAYTAVPRKKQYPKTDGCPLKYTKDGIWFGVHMCLWEIQSTGWFGGDAIAHPTSAWYTPPGLCAPELAGSKFGNDYGSAVEWANAFQLGVAADIKGVNLKATFATTTHTGYDADALLIYHYPKHNGWICGTNLRPTKAAILVARAHRV
jgi:hypothetical protein